MPTYISLVEWTQDGIEAVEESPDRLDDAKALAESLDGEVKQFFMTMGQYDIVTVCEFPDDDAMAQFALQVGSQGAVSTETLKAYPEDEYRDIIDSLGGVPGGVGGHTA